MDELDRYLDRLDRAFMRMGRQHAVALADTGLTGGQFMMLRVLDGRGPTNPSSLANTFGVTLASITAAVKRLSRDGLVLRYEDESNRRYVIIEITSEGRRVLGHAEKRRREIMRDMFGRATLPEICHLTELVERLAGE